MNFTFEFDNDMRFGFENIVPKSDSVPKLQGIAAISASGSTGVIGNAVVLDTEEE